jgi:AcrR family transcriptional regulator
MPTAAPASSPRKTPIVRRELILDAAEALFAERGFAGVSVRDIAGEVGVTAASLYNHFPSKDALYVAVLERGIRPVFELLAARREEPPGPDASEQIVAAVTELFASRPHLPRLIYHEAVSGGAHLADFTRNYMRPALEVGLAEMKRERDAKWTPEEYPFVIFAWLHMVLSPFALAPLYKDILGDDPLSPAMLERQTGFLRKLARILAAAPPSD